MKDQEFWDALDKAGIIRWDGENWTFSNSRVEELLDRERKFFTFKDMYEGASNKLLKYSNAEEWINERFSPVPRRIVDIMLWFKQHEVYNDKGWNECWNIVLPYIKELAEVYHSSTPLLSSEVTET